MAGTRGPSRRTSSGGSVGRGPRTRVGAERGTANNSCPITASDKMPMMTTCLPAEAEGKAGEPDTTRPTPTPTPPPGRDHHHPTGPPQHQPHPAPTEPGPATAAAPAVPAAPTALAVPAAPAAPLAPAAPVVPDGGEGERGGGAPRGSRRSRRLRRPRRPRHPWRLRPAFRRTGPPQGPRPPTPPTTPAPGVTHSGGRSGPGPTWTRQELDTAELRDCPDRASCLPRWRSTVKEGETVGDTGEHQSTHLDHDGDEEARVPVHPHWRGRARTAMSCDLRRYDPHWWKGSPLATAGPSPRVGEGSRASLP